MDESQLLKSHSGTERSGLPPRPPTPPPISNLTVPSTSQPSTSHAPAAASTPISLSELANNPNCKHVRITHDQFLELMKSPITDPQIKKLQERIHAASFPPESAETTPGKNFYSGPRKRADNDPLKFRLDVTGVPGNDESPEQLSIAFTKQVGSPGVQMRAYQGTQLHLQDQNKALLEVSFDKPQAGSRTAELRWVGSRDEQNPANISGSALMKVFQGVMKDSGCTCSLKDDAGKVIDSKKPDEGQSKLKIVGAYSPEGKTWYMKEGATPQNETAWNNATQKLSKLKVSDVERDLGDKRTNTSPPSKMTMQQIIDVAAQHVAAASKGTYKDAQDVKNNMPLGEFYRKLSSPDVLNKLQGEADKHGISSARMAHDFYSGALERNVNGDPNPELKAAIAAVQGQSTFHFDFSPKTHNG